MISRAKLQDIFVYLCIAGLSVIGLWHWVEGIQDWREGFLPFALALVIWIFHRAGNPAGRCFAGIFYVLFSLSFFALFNPMDGGADRLFSDLEIALCLMATVICVMGALVCLNPFKKV